MDQISERDLRLHVNIVGWILIVSHAVFLLIGGFVFVLLAGIGLLSMDAQAFGVLGVIGSVVGLFLALLALPGIAAGWGLLARQGWARILAIVVAGLGLFNFPVGTAIGVYTLWVLLQRSADAYFGARL
ncbi:MAG: hypothetical protein HPY83_07345 [Anaerolineae bacterium]|nr:hypothetical protein [Anaerolineae bacterium]